jgi:hypothetical protein
VLGDGHGHGDGERPSAGGTRRGLATTTTVKTRAKTTARSIGTVAAGSMAGSWTSYRKERDEVKPVDNGILRDEG